MAAEKVRIFIVEDDEMYSATIRHKVVNRFDADVEVFNNGDSVLANLDQNPDIILLDYLLKDETGGDILKQIRKISPNVEVVVLSGQSDTNAVQELFELGIHDYIIKKKDAFDKLEETIEFILQKNQKKGFFSFISKLFK